MTCAVRYYSMTGNTEKLAFAVAKEAGVEAKTVLEGLDEKVDVLFLGSAVYAAGVDEKIKTFISSLSPDKVGCVVNFSTACLLPSTFKQVKKLVEAQGVKMSDREFHCRGNFHGIHKNHPDEKDIEAMTAFTKEILGK